ncbi:MAG: GntR family transcriptional regulator [Candidatus Devosia phytovorans]|uniref:GntR family transcriptional regulator n=1 Tax=Candidatus Devosia phytovorans TaxID=3121372 RepID=A0AAJ5VRN3_9HYPH|nr:GntR family transcriptional regulator [Devosia sp.]WEK03404.1 MAG: GntR family transcriptional regulator [Devosia sp.]
MDSSDSQAPTPLKRPTRLGDEVYNAIYAQLMTRQIAPGGRISVDRLVRTLGVSQTPIREALSRLEAQGLVVKAHLIGYSAANQMDSARLDQLYELRLLLEPFAAGRAASLLTDDGRANLIRLAAEMQAGDTGPEAYGRFARLDSEFHDVIAHASGNELVQETLASLHTHVHLFRLFYHARVTSDAIAEHENIIAALVARDAPAAEDAMRAHIQRSRDRFMKAFAS